jgi:hypothetical protein
MSDVEASGDFLLLDELAQYMENRKFAPVEIVYTGQSIDPSSAHPTTVSLIPYGSAEQYDPTDEEVRFQLVTRGANAFAVASACYAGIGGREIRLPSGHWVSILALQSAPFVVKVEDTGGWHVAQNFSMRYEVAEA